ncbi:acetyl-CoA carboxylase biotin carboxylase subunit [Robertmurraya korlensis]|uniref:acetyl-CoA carboxylase biotin carboxylase subunit n=1 Tax=Robertmurraya korlensis TaxID=519977 RepID=UPI0008261D93|nr:acetyl-CoA carboxylase biotin carboxylase subunit [Robertmurraya korlensis]
MQKILIANRGEIASRIIRTCNKLGIETVAVYSDADRDLPFVAEATTSYRIGEAPVGKSYMNHKAILEIAKKEKVDALHPGYGFLSENASFAEEVGREGIIFIGPTPKTILMMGDKILSRDKMLEAGIPVVPGSNKELTTKEEAIAAANSIGYPVILKASGGGGGIGMVRCEDEQTLLKNLETTKKRAKTYFANEKVYVEKYIQHARHIEVQIFGDKAGNIVHLFERDCSIQRRHQKVLEESPSPFLTNGVKEKIFQAAVQAAKAVGYENAGTVEFIVDEEENFYFLEMNTRLQVEHPVTEAITGIDLVEWQILVAKGETLPNKQEQLLSQGHAIEFRLYAEDPVTFMPSPGYIELLDWGEDDTRVDYGYKAGVSVTPYYDPMVAKCIVRGENRNEAIEKASRFFTCLRLEGIKTNAPLFKQILNDIDFKNGNYSTNYLSKKRFIQ